MKPEKTIPRATVAAEVGRLTDHIARRLLELVPRLPASAANELRQAADDIRRLADEQFGERPPYHSKPSGEPPRKTPA